MAERRGSHWQAVKAVFWSFFGVRRKTDYEQDAVHLTPVQVIVIGLAGALIFIFTVLGIVMLVTR